ncbi:uncharacterized protein FFB20_10154 [Fusarium fujikuroi]|nr:uncharacterized protein FFB20_10154 [Fusarium fujikuroi]
MQLLTSLMGDF